MLEVLLFEHKRQGFICTQMCVCMSVRGSVYIVCMCVCVCIRVQVC